MAHGKLCRLCVTNSEVYESLYDDDGQKNEVYQLMVKFFDATLLNAGQASRLTCMCLKCWHTILDFHHFQQSVLKAQERLLEDDCQFEEVHVKQETMDSAEECTALHTVDVPVKSKEVVLADTANKEQCKKYNNGSENIQDEQKLALNDVNSDDGSTQDNKVLYNDTESTLMENEFLSASEDNDEELFSDENMLVDEEENISRSFSKDENDLQKKVRIDDFIADWKPNLECVVCLQLYPSYSLLQEHFCQNHPQAEFYILCCRRKFNNLFKITEHIRLRRCSSVIKCVLCNKSFTERSALDLHMDIYHANPNEENSSSDFDSADEIESANLSEEGLLPDNDSTQDNEKMSKETVPTLEENEVHSESEDNDGPFCSDENSLTEKDDFKNKISTDDNCSVKRSFKKKRHLRKKTRVDDFIAHWRPSLECVVCLQLFQRFSLLQQHFRKDHPKDEFYILCCRRKLKDRYNITEHIRFHIDPTGNKCFLCKKSFTARSSLDRHMDICHPIPNEGNSAPNADAIDNILKANTSIKKQPERRTVQDFDECIAKWMPNLECIICSETRPTFTLLQQHFRQKHPKEQCYIKCCQRKLKNRSVLADHAKLHSDPNAYMCEICKKSFCMRRSLLRHMRTHDDNANANLNKTPKDNFIDTWKSHLECVVCNDTCDTLKLLREHFQHKHPSAEFYILCCQRKLKDLQQIKEHILLHIDPDSFRCELCKRCFNTRSNLLRHMRSHHPIFDDGTGKIPESRRKTTKELDDVITQWKSNLECELCSVTCPNFALLQEHFRQEHPQEQCYIVCCQRNLKDRYGIVDHIRVHNDQNAFK